MTDRITDEMVEADARAICASSLLDPDLLILDDSDETKPDRPWIPQWSVFARYSRAALSAALPLMDRWIKIEGEPDTSKAPWDVRSVWGADARTKEQYEMWWSGSRFETDFDDTPTPTHWMPLPPAPKGE